MNRHSPRRRLVGVVAGVGLVAGALVAVPAPATAAGPCDPPTNPVVCENSKPGTDPEIWQISGSGDPTIQGFATDASVDVGGSISFKVKTSAAYSMTVYRLGWYQGLGAREIATLTPTPRTQPACLTDPATSLYDCGNWGVSATWTVPSTAISGVYIVRIRRNDTGGDSHIPFVVRDETSQSDIVMQTSDTTWQAYNQYGGSDFYTGGGSVGRAYKVSYNRPYATRDVVNGRDFLFSNEYPTIRFLESNGYDVSYISGVDTDRNGASLLNHKVFLSVGHDEYWSGAARANVEAARDAGVNLAFFSGNEVYWRTRWENSIDGSGTARRTLVSYKETWSNAKVDPSSQWTGTWRDPRFTPPGTGGGNPENGLTGTLYMSNNTDLPIEVPAQQGRNRYWRNTPVGTAAAAGTTSTIAPHSVGYESNEDLDNGFRPAGLIRLSTTEGPTPQYLMDFGNVVQPGTTKHHMTLYRAASGALVFSAGTIQYAWALDSMHDGEATTPDQSVRQATVNLFADMGAQPRTLVSGLTLATKSTDTTGPSATITAPAAGSVANGTLVTVTGTASDVGGGVVAGVEVSVDDGVTWHPATGTTSWTYQGAIAGNGSIGIKARAVDDSANIGPVVTRTMNVSCPCSVFGDVMPRNTSVDDTSAVELGVRFQATSDGFVTGVRFYKGAANTGTHTGSLWSATGSRLATGTFTGETATGWQTLIFATPVSITAGTTYVVSYTAPSGRYAADPWTLSYRDTPTGPVKALRSSSASKNGLFGNPGQFPTESFQDTNYYVDVAFTPAGSSPPVPVTTVPASGATGASAPTVVANFNVAVNPGSATFTVKAGATTVAGTTSLDSTNKVLTFTPSAALAPSTSFTATVSGAVSATGVPMAGPYSWTFTTGAPCPCTVFGGQIPSVVDAGDASAIEVGMQFVPLSSGSVTGVRFYKSVANTGTHTGSLWSSTGTRLATGTFAGESASGWQTLTFASAVNVTAGTTYVVSYYAPNGRYSADSGFFASSLTRGPLTVPAGSNGVYRYGAGGGFPSSSFNASNYWVDVVFSDASAPVDTTPPVVSAVSVVPGQTSATVAWTTNEPSSSVVSYGTSAGSLGSSASSPGSVTAHSVTVSGLAPGTAYFLRVTSSDPAGNAATSPASSAAPLTFTTTSVSCPCTVLPAASVPAVADSGDTAAVELGLRFVPAASGVVTGVKFYKSVANSGTHTGSLWSSTGTRLATGTFTGESASGWQTMTFASPVNVTAGTTYVVSYYAPNGRYSATGGYFADDVVSGPLTAPAGANGVYRYGAGGGFPSSSFNASNYWVDVVFVDSASLPSTGPTVSGVSASVTQTTATVTWTTGTPATSVVSYGTSASALTSTAESAGSVTSHSVTLTGLAPGTAYHFRVTSAAGGATTTSPASPSAPLTLTTSPCPCSVFTSSATPAVVDSGESAALELGMRFVPGVSGQVTGVRFYKSAANTGAHTGSLWTSSGTLLATGTFTGETASGWQTLTFSAPVSVTAGQEYVVSYYTPTGRYSYDAGYFTADVSRPPLTAPAGQNGLYRYGVGGGFPTASWNSTNYWVDVVFTS